jgi:hypothetical protein
MATSTCCVCLEIIAPHCAIACEHPPSSEERIYGYAFLRPVPKTPIPIHSTCERCVLAMVRMAIEKMETDFTCQNCEGQACKGTLSNEIVKTMTKRQDANLYQRFLNVATLKENPHLRAYFRECPRCCVLVERQRWGNAMSCSECLCSFCFVHGEPFFLQHFCSLN